MGYSGSKAIFIICFLALLTACILSITIKFLGALIIFWASVSLFSFFRIVNSYHDTGEVCSRDKSVGLILKGLQRQGREKQKAILRSNLNSSLFILISMSAFSSLLIFLDGAPNALNYIGIVTLSVLIFWNIHNHALNPYKASLVGTLLSAILCIQILFFHDLYIDLNRFTHLSFVNLALMGPALFLGGVYLNGMITRHKYRLFPITGLFLLGFAMIMGAQLALMTIPVLSALLGICFSQSFSTWRQRDYKDSCYSEFLA